MYHLNMQFSHMNRLYPFTVTKLLTVFLLISFSIYSPIQASCRTSANEPICCTGKQSHCYGFEIDFKNSALFKMGYNKTDLIRMTQSRGSAVPTGIKMKRCFCDDSCVYTKDCCPDYRDLCEKPVVDCQVGQWSEWSECSKKCGRGVEHRTRGIVKHPQNGGRQCPMVRDERSCQGTRCGRRRVGRSNFIDYYRLYKEEVVNIVSIQGNPQTILRQFDPRFDIRRQLYYGRLYQKNITEMPEPDPYSIVYEVTTASPGCQQDRSNWSSLREQYRRMNPYELRRRMLSTRDLKTGSFVCITCFPNFMRKELGLKCAGTQYGGHAFRFRNLDKFDCYGTAKLLDTYAGKDHCEFSVPHYAFV